MTRALVDVNILVYASNADEMGKHQRAKQFMNRIIQNPNEYAISQQSLREFVSVSIKKSKLSTTTIRKYVSEFQCAFGELLIDLPIDSLTAISLIEQQKVPFWDALLMSTAMRHDILTIYTEDVKDFERIPGIKVINPLAI